MPVIKELKSTAKFPVLNVLIFILVFGYLDYGTIIMLSKLPSIVNEILSADSNMLVLADIGTIFVIVFMSIVLVWFNIGIIHAMVEYVRLIGVSVTLLDEGIEIEGRSKKAFIPNSSIIHISSSHNKRSLLIVWNGAKDIMTFIISTTAFGRQDINEAVSVLKEKDVYVDDQKKAREFRKQIKKFQLSGILWPFRTFCDIADGIEK